MDITFGRNWVKTVGGDVMRIGLAIVLSCLVPLQSRATPPTSTGISAETSTPSRPLDQLNPGNAYFVIGLRPRNIKIQVKGAKVDEGKISRWDFGLGRSYGQSDYDFVIFQAEGGKSLAIQSLSFMFGKSIFGVYTQPTCDGAYLTFSAPPGEIVYISTISILDFKAENNYQSIKWSSNVTYNDEFEQAKDFIRENYPQLTDQLTRGSYTLVQPCPDRYYHNHPWPLASRAQATDASPPSPTGPK